MGGTIEVESELGKGSEFHVTLDLQRAETPEEDMLLPEWNILVVDDDQQLCESTVTSLKSIGVRADWALNAERAMEMLDHRVSIRDNYHIILLDWKLPDIDGISAAKEIRRRYGRHHRLHLQAPLPLHSLLRAEALCGRLRQRSGALP